MHTKEIILNSLSTSLRNVFHSIPEDQFNNIEEIRIRVNKPLMIRKTKSEYFLTPSGELSKVGHHAFMPNLQDIGDSLELMSDYSLYAFEEELKNGYITLQGGHRVGLVGKAIIDQGKLKTLRYISGLNIRVSREILGCANEVMSYIVKNNSIYHTLIVSPPKCGKTTLLRDMIRQISNGIPRIMTGMTVGVVDERSEIGGCYLGIPQNDIGIRTDILDCCPKAEGMMMLLRSMAPDVIAVDEIGHQQDIYAIEDILNAGVKLICTVHGSSLEDIIQKPVLSELLDKKIFQRIIFLSYRNGPGTIEAIIDGQSFVPILRGIK